MIVRVDVIMRRLQILVFCSWLKDLLSSVLKFS
jgi:hypothetical protein